MPSAQITSDQDAIVTEIEVAAPPERVFKANGEVLEFDPPRLLAYTWMANWHAQTSRRTVVRWELTPSGKGTKVKGYAQRSVWKKLPPARTYNGGWPGVVEFSRTLSRNKQESLYGDRHIDSRPGRGSWRSFHCRTAGPCVPGDYRFLLRCRCGGGNKACTASLSGRPIFARAANGRASGWARMARRFAWTVNIWKSIPLACWSIPGSQVGAVR
jgi:hypothetical protein